VERRRARSDGVQLTCNRFQLVPNLSHLFLYQAVPFSSVVAGFFPEFVA
jgi:hypothetical protein